MSKIHPELNAPGAIRLQPLSLRLIIDKASIAWGEYKWSAGGCTIHWDDSESNYLAAQRPQNTLFFAGEHCSRFPAWLQGSIESSLEAVCDIVKHKQVTKSTAVNTISRTNRQLVTV